MAMALPIAPKLRGKRRGKPRRSPVWLYFSLICDEKAKCNICNNIYAYSCSSGTTSNLKKHLQIKHPSVPVEGETYLTPDEDAIKEDHKYNETDDLGENILIEYYDDEIQEKGNFVPPKERVVKQKILRIPISRRLSGDNLETERNENSEFNPKCSSPEDPRSELAKIEIELARQDLQLKKNQVIYAEREDERRQKEHELTLKIREAQLQNILNKNVP